MTTADRLTNRVWLAARKRRSARRPLPLVVIAENLMGVSTGADHSRRILNHYLEQGGDIYLLTECAKADIAAVVGPQWGVVQFGANAGAPPTAKGRPSPAPRSSTCAAGAGSRTPSSSRAPR